MKPKFAIASAACAAVLCLGMGGAHAQQTVITNGGVTVHNANGTTTRVNNNGVVTTGHARRQSPRRPALRIGQSGSVSVTGSNKRLTLNGRSGVVNVSGSRNHVTVTGVAERVVVSGSNNFVLAERVGVIEADGSNNQIVWRYGSTKNASPGIVRSGTNNSVTHRR